MILLLRLACLTNYIASITRRAMIRGKQCCSVYMTRCCLFRQQSMLPSNGYVGDFREVRVRICVMSLCSLVSGTSSYANNSE